MDTKTLCLGALSLGEASGYEIRKLFEEGPFSHFHDTSFGAIYPALNRLAEEGLAECATRPQEGRPDKKVYRLTEAGRETLRRALRKPPARDKLRSECLFMLFFADLLDTPQREAVFAAYRQGFAGTLECLEERACQPMSPGRRFVHGFGRAIHRAALEYMDANRAMLFEDEDDQTTRECAE